MSRDEKKESVESRVLSENELNSVSGGRYYTPVSGCPRGVTKLQHGREGIDDSQCAGCANLLTGQAYGGHYCGIYCWGQPQWE
jgi:bacteriocin-like protein